jgi:hypothetical protein
MIRIFRLFNALRGPWIADDPNPIPSRLDLWDGAFDPYNDEHCAALLAEIRAQQEADRRG